MSKFGFSSQSAGAGIVEADDAEEDTEFIGGDSLAVFEDRFNGISLMEAFCGLGVEPLEASVDRIQLQVFGRKELGPEYD